MSSLEPKTPLRLLIIADDPIARMGLAAMLTACDIVGQTDHQHVVEELELYQPDVALWDVGWAADDLPPHVAEIAEQLPLVLLLPAESESGELLGLGVKGLLTRSASAEQIITALEAVWHNLLLIDPTFSDSLMTNAAAETTLLEPLTPREQEVLQLLAAGLPNKSIARQLYISDHTVKFHVNAILSKLNAQSRTEAAVIATRMGLIVV